MAYSSYFAQLLFKTIIGTLALELIKAMKNDNLIHLIGAVFVLAGTGMKIFHLPYAEFGDLISKLAFIAVFLYMAFQNKQLKKKIQKLEN